MRSLPEIAEQLNAWAQAGRAVTSETVTNSDFYREMQNEVRLDASQSNLTPEASFCCNL